MASHASLLEKSVERSTGNSMKDLIFEAQIYDEAVRCNAAYEKCLFREGTIILMNEMLQLLKLEKLVETCLLYYNH